MTETQTIRAMLERLRAVKKWFAKLENGTPPDDPLTGFRQRFHKPVHDELDAAIATGEAWLKNQA